VLLYGKLDVSSFAPVLRENALEGMQTLLKYFKAKGSKYEIPKSLTNNENSVLQATELNPEIAKIIHEIWTNNEIQKYMEKLGTRIEEAQFLGGVTGIKYYFDNVERFASDTFEVTTADMLKARRKTIGVHETQFFYRNVQFNMIDVGGQRSERKKWLHCLADVNVVIFLTALNDYDQTLEEDPETNRMVESLKLWKLLSSSEYLKNTPFILFLNKSDLFEEKIQKVPLCDVFEEYQPMIAAPGTDFEKGCKFISKQYETHFSGAKPFSTHITNSLDTTCVSKIFELVSENMINEMLKSHGLMIT